MVYAEVTWIFVVATIAAVFVAYGIGANDYGNSFGTSVGSGTLSMKQAILVASVCEFGGAVLMGSGVTDTIRNQIADVSAFQSKPDVFAYGMLCAMLASGIWLILATYWELPVSTTHSIVGALVGMTMVAAGPNAVNWSERTDTFPFLGGMSSVVLSWLFSPILTGALSLTLFLLLRTLVLRSPRAYQRAYYVLPVFVFLTFFMIAMFIIQSGGPRFEWDHTSVGKACWISACVGAGTTLVALAVQWLLIRKRVDKDLKLEAEQAAARATAAREAAAAVAFEPTSSGRLEGAHDAIISDVIGHGDPLAFGYSQGSDESGSPHPESSTGRGQTTTTTTAAGAGGGGGTTAAAAAASMPAGAAALALDIEAPQPHSSGIGMRHGRPLSDGSSAPRTPAALHKFRQSHLWSVITHGANFDIHEIAETDERISTIHYHSERFDWKAEGVFKYLQVFTACANSFAHGSNDVANAIGPYAAIYLVWTHASIEVEAEVPVWILVLGGLGLVLGLATYGYKIMRILGVKMTRLTNSRGFVVEISAAIVVVLGSRYSLPISTTHCLVGAVAGIGLAEGGKGFNWVLLLRFFAGWVATLVVAAVTSAAFTAQGLYSPTNTAAKQRAYMANYLEATTLEIAKLLNGSGVPAYAADAAAIMSGLAALPSPLLDLSSGADLQQQAMVYYQNATTWRQ